MTPAQQVIADLHYILERYDDFHDARIKGTPRPWQQPVVMSVAVADRIEQAREYADRTDEAIGEHAAPLHLDVLDALIDLLATSADLAERVAQDAGVDRLPPVAGATDDPCPYLQHTITHLPGIGYELLEHVGAQATRLRLLVDRHLGELTTGQRLLAECPWCSGVTAEHPAGGGFTLRVRKNPAGQILVVCESGGCEPAEADCGIRYRGHPAWDLHTEGDWLAERIEHHQKQGAAA